MDFFSEIKVKKGDCYDKCAKFGICYTKAQNCIF